MSLDAIFQDGNMVTVLYTEYSLNIMTHVVRYMRCLLNQKNLHLILKENLRPGALA